MIHKVIITIGEKSYVLHIAEITDEDGNLISFHLVLFHPLTKEWRDK